MEDKQEKDKDQNKESDSVQKEEQITKLTEDTCVEGQGIVGTEHDNTTIGDTSIDGKGQETLGIESKITKIADPSMEGKGQEALGPNITNIADTSIEGKSKETLGIEPNNTKIADTSMEGKGQEALEIEHKNTKNDDTSIEGKGQETLGIDNDNHDVKTTDNPSNHIKRQEMSFGANPQSNRPHIVNFPMTDEELGIYEDPGDSDGLSDTEIAIAADDKREKTRGKVKTLETTKTPALGIRKSSRIGAYSKLGTVPSGYRGVANTPATYSEFDDQRSSVTWSARQPMGVFISRKQMKSGSKSKSINQTSRIGSRIGNRSADSRNASRVASESREAMFRRAMALLSARCTSVVGSQTVETPFGTVKQPTFGIQVPQYFYIKQEKPRPMPPLKAWQGYNGNVYFEPISIAGMPNDVLIPKSGKSRASHVNDRMNRTVPGQKRPMTEPDRSDSNSMNSSLSRTTGNSNKSTTKTRPSTRQNALLDKRTVLNRYNTSLDEDITWIETTENTGSLAVRPKSDNIIDYKTRHDQMYNRERICKGSVAHRQYIAKMQGQKPSLRVSGGKYSTPSSASPLLRTQTQYSLSNNRRTTNSPDPYAAQLPPLEQLRNSVCHIDNHDKQTYGRQRPVTDDIKPFIKYSPEIKIKQPTVNYV